MQLETFNQLDSAEAGRVLQACVHIPAWGAELVQQRPYLTKDQLYQVAVAQAQTWSWSDIAEALAQHPRIGEKKAAAVLSEKEQQFSQREQAQVETDAVLQLALYQGNLDYEHKFGHIFLIRAAGRSGQQILSELQRRLLNTAEQEQAEVKQQLAEIALIRLKQEIQ
ncbi:OHCU decarboxylase [Acinetobacter sp. ANC 3929]|uniref:2-oxo-4-hydroxy-4-carboxy-5-ureidoimidazoline decarboxylase n=1 Tax=unclassified Acinetobacter TaxID=196816 RepID=UPI0002CF6E2D|nr:MULTISPECIES: 2-oxo-4-hydroxy-4-carboxy-5-ureidoimidazoline decarboxylase [unclassified Acinetobacter]ENW79931.1 OHCU decarboxylase [Acinetobacter sp. ANC 3929]MCH7352705.1 2-oxo-4-hydroxy-4-carboxy-5-ureidoimidazoline decarboxylase [Acinetobacter sp. NIPH 2023]MCH7357158.1 2-oxo-4-hydroxy-4-carboxy-5-ureidoimidazoline decarboxylase [Acinetobacter sp. NIPH 1958]MCH7360099.1 2-oxo-4-hydroxy-4-carboxy-5-ureidoimidazoline decarboxylase [Acinetobacter sp. NIPH 2024]